MYARLNDILTQIILQKRFTNNLIIFHMPQCIFVQLENLETQIQ